MRARAHQLAPPILTATIDQLCDHDLDQLGQPRPTLEVAIDISATPSCKPVAMVSRALCKLTSSLYDGYTV